MIKSGKLLNLAVYKLNTKTGRFNKKTISGVFTSPQEFIATVQKYLRKKCNFFEYEQRAIFMGSTMSAIRKAIKMEPSTGVDAWKRYARQASAKIDWRKLPKVKWERFK